MKPKIEATFITIDKTKVRKKLESLDAKLIQPESRMRRVVFAVDDHSFIRVRDENRRITISYKRLDSKTLSGMKETCLEVNNYDNAIQFIKDCGFRPKAEQESLREEWELGYVEITIDTWPWLPSYVEIEGPSEVEVKNISEKLGFDFQNAIFGAVDRVYRIYYDVTATDINECPEIKFTEIPAWLEQKRRNAPLPPELYNN